MTRYRLTHFGKPVGDWRETAKEAREDAVQLKLGGRDEHIPDRIFLEPGVEIERREP